MEPEKENGSGPRRPVQPFLRKGQGTARFGMTSARRQSGSQPVNSPLIQLPRFTPTSSIPLSARTLDSGYSNEDETRPPTTASLPIDRDPNSSTDQQNIQNPRRTPMVHEEEEPQEEEGAASEDVVHHQEEEETEEVSAVHIQTFWPDSGASSLANTDESEHSTRARAFRAMAEEMHERRIRIQQMPSVSVTPASYGTPDLSGPIGASTPIHAVHPSGVSQDSEAESHQPLPPFPSISASSLETPARPFSTNRVNVMANEAQTGISLLGRRSQNQRRQNPRQNPPNPRHQNQENVRTPLEHVYDQPIRQNQNTRLQNPQNLQENRQVRNLMIQLRDAIAHIDFADEQVRSTGRRLQEAVIAIKEEYKRRTEELEEEFRRRIETVEEENRAEREQIKRERRDLERDKKMVKNESGGKVKEQAQMIETLRKKLSDAETRLAQARQDIRSKDDKLQKKEEELKKMEEIAERHKKNGEVMQKELRRFRTESAKREKEEQMRIQAEMRRLGNQKLLQNQSFGAPSGASRTQRTSESTRKSSSGSRGRSVSFADVPEETEVFEEQHSDTIEHSVLPPVMTPGEKGQTKYGPFTVWRDPMGEYTRVTKTADGGRLFEYSDGNCMFLTAQKSFMWQRRLDGTILMHVIPARIMFTYFHNQQQLEIVRPNHNITVISVISDKKAQAERRSVRRVEHHCDENTGQHYTQIFDACFEEPAGKCVTRDQKGIGRETKFQKGDTVSYRQSNTRCVKYLTSCQDFEFMEPEFRLRWYIGPEASCLSAKFFHQSGSEKPLSLKLSLIDASGQIEAIDTENGQIVKRSMLFEWDKI